MSWNTTTITSFETISHNLLLAKLKSYGIAENVLKLMCSS